MPDSEDNSLEKRIIELCGKPISKSELFSNIEEKEKNIKKALSNLSRERKIRIFREGEETYYERVKKIELKIKVPEKIFLIFSIVVVVGLLIFYFFYYLDIAPSVDEMEHLHSGWYVYRGFIPYNDFFQHHNPLLWYILAGFLSVVGESTLYLYVTRIFFFLIFVVNALLVFKISRKLYSENISLLCSIFFLTSPFFLGLFMPRPDPLGLTFFLLSVFFFLNFKEENNYKNLLPVAVFSAVSFLAIQKSIFFIPFFLLVLFQKNSVKNRALFASFFSVMVLIIIFSFIFFTGISFQKFVYFNYDFNLLLKQDKTFCTSNTFIDNILIRGIQDNVVFLAVSIFGIVLLLRNYKKEVLSLALIFFSVVLSFFTCFVFDHDFIFLDALLSIFAIGIIGSYIERFFEPKNQRYAFFVLIIFSLLAFSPHFIIENKDVFETNQGNDLSFENFVKVQDYILKNTAANDIVYFGYWDNVFRKDLYYVWFCEPCKYSVQANRLNLFYESSVDLIALKRPKIIKLWRCDNEMINFLGNAGYKQASLDQNIFKCYFIRG